MQMTGGPESGIDNINCTGREQRLVNVRSPHPLLCAEASASGADVSDMSTNVGSKYRATTTVNLLMLNTVDFQ